MYVGRPLLKSMTSKSLEGLFSITRPWYGIRSEATVISQVVISVKDVIIHIAIATHSER